MIAKLTEKASMIRLTLLFTCMAAIVTVMCFYGIVRAEAQYANKIYPNVYLDNKSVGGMTKQQAQKLYDKKNKQLQSVKISVFYDKQVVGTFSASIISLKVNSAEIIDRAYLIGRSDRWTSKTWQQLSMLANLRQYNFQTKVVYDKSAFDDFVSTLEENYNKPAKNALFTFENNKVTNFRKEENGVKIDSVQLLADIDKAVNDLNYKAVNKTIQVKAISVKPEVTLSEANNFGIDELIGEGQSDYSGSIDTRIHNVKLAAAKFNGVLIPKGATLSFNDIIGDISAATGYLPAYVIKNGRTVLGDGGGVCQVSTTLFRAALYTGLPVIERTAHDYRVHYYENDALPGLDATVFGPTVDLKIKNDTPAAILIQTEIDDEHNILRFKLYGKRDGRVAEVSPITVYAQQPAPEPLYQDDPTLPKGVVKQVDWAAPGAKSVFHYKVTRNNKILIDQDFYSNYRPWQAVYLVGQG